MQHEGVIADSLAVIPAPLVHFEAAFRHLGDHLLDM